MYQNKKLIRKKEKVKSFATSVRFIIYVNCDFSGHKI